ncbi:ABC-three component system middle component 6 [Azospirillum sp. Marseille-Q6669]
MILPGKHLPVGRSLIGVGGEILAQLGQPREVSELWERFRAARAAREEDEPVPFDWFVLALTFLHAVRAVHMADGVIAAGDPGL